MCGIAGILQFNGRLDGQPAHRARLDAMLAHMARRGLDGHGASAHGPCALAHARLAILDTFGGRQPMHAPARPEHGLGAVHVVFNGEIYNHRALRRKLQYLGHQFVTDHSDTEVLLHGYRQWGTNLPEHLEGMFAFAVWDEDDQQLFLARDRAGQKPLYLRETDHDLTFASLPATLVAGAGEAPGIDRAALLTYLRFGYTFSESLIESITELPPAHWMTMRADGKRHLARYWHAPTPVIRESVRSAAQDVHHTLSDAVAARLEADVPLGCFLSGGVDSSIIAALAQRALHRDRGETLRTFSVAMPSTGYDESEHAKAVADHIGSEHHVLQAEPGNAIEDLEHLMALSGEPTADSSVLPTYWLCKAARREATVALSGDGGDELFAGYDRYRAMKLLHTHAWWLQFVPTGFLRDVDPRSLKTRIRRLVEAAQAGGDPAQWYRSMIHLFSDPQIRELSIRGVSQWARMWTPPVPDWPVASDVVQAAMAWDKAHYLPHVLLRKVDRASMAVPLEVRSPMLDTRVMELAAIWRPSVLMKRGRPKAVLRALGEELLPASILRRPKRGFAIPIGEWFRGPLRDELGDRLFDGTLDDMGVARGAVECMFQEHTNHEVDHTHRLFALLQLALWGQWARTQHANTNTHPHASVPAPAGRRSAF